MTHFLLLTTIYFAALLGLAKPLGSYMARLFGGQRTFLHALLRPVERGVYRLTGVDEHAEQRWTEYTLALLAFSAAGFVLAFAIQLLQGHLPWNPMGFGTAHKPAGATPMTLDLAFNSAFSFVTNTNWQAYSGESTVSYFTQMTAFTVQNFVSAASGVAMAMVLIRGFARRESKTVGNFWVDLTRATVYLLLPLAFFAALLLASQGVIQNLRPSVVARTLEGSIQIIPQGPVASQEAIKMLGTNGGGFFNANSAHPFENPTPFSNFVEMLLIFAIPAGLTYTFGRDVGDTRQGWALFAAMSILFLVGAGTLFHYEQRGNPLLTQLGLQARATPGQPGGNMEGKETRFGIADSALFATITTDASCGAVNAAHDSLTPLGGLVPLFNMELGEVVFGGVGAGLLGMLLFAILAVFIAGLMVGRTPEYLGKKIERREVQLAMIALIATAASMLVFTAVASVAQFRKGGYWNPPGAAIANLTNGGPHGFTELLYAYSSTSENNGSAFAGLNADTPYYNFTTAGAMLIGRFAFLIPLLAVGGSLASKKRLAITSGTLPTNGPLFVGLLIGTILLVGALTFFPALSLGPVAEHYLMQAGHVF